MLIVYLPGWDIMGIWNGNWFEVGELDVVQSKHIAEMAHAQWLSVPLFTDVIILGEL